MMKIKRVRARLGNCLAPVFALVLFGGLSACSTTGGSGFLSFGSGRKTCREATDGSQHDWCHDTENIYPPSPRWPVCIHTCTCDESQPA